MSSKLTPGLLEPISQAVRRQKPSRFQCLNHQLQAARQQQQQPFQSRSLSTSTTLRADLEGQEARAPRWAQTPARMKAPVSLRARKPKNNWIVNESQDKLDAFYRRLLGDGGDKLLTDEVKWLAVTHKSFDQGRRGYNDRLAFLGKRILSLQTSLALLNRTDGTFVDLPDQYEREPFRHPGVDLLPRLTEENKNSITDKARLANFTQNIGLLDVLRWKPRDAQNLYASGVETALSQALCAIIGAIALQRGGEVATRVVKDKILSQLSTGDAE